MKKWMILVLVALLAGAFAFAETLESARIGGEAPDFEVTTPDNQTYRLSDFRGKAVYLNLWATWCPPCRAEMPDIQKLADAHPDDLVILGISLDEAEEEMAEYVRENGYDWIFAMDWTYEITTVLYPTDAIPFSVFIDPNGIITSMDRGKLTYAQMEYRCQAALDNAQAE